MSVREREDAPNSDISPVPVSDLVDDRTRQPKESPTERGNLCDDPAARNQGEFGG